MAAEIGIYYFDQETGYPAVVLKTLDDGRVLVRVWTVSGDAQHAAVKSATPGAGIFVPNAS